MLARTLSSGRGCLGSQAPFSKVCVGQNSISTIPTYLPTYIEKYRISKSSQNLTGHADMSLSYTSGLYPYPIDRSRLTHLPQQTSLPKKGEKKAVARD